MTTTANTLQPRAPAQLTVLSGLTSGDLRVLSRKSELRVPNANERPCATTGARRALTRRACGAMQPPNRFAPRQTSSPHARLAAA